MGETEHIDFHEFWIFGLLGSPICWFEYTKLLLKFSRKSDERFCIRSHTFRNLRTSVDLPFMCISIFNVWKFEKCTLEVEVSETLFFIFDILGVWLWHIPNFIFGIWNEEMATKKRRNEETQQRRIDATKKLIH